MKIILVFVFTLLLGVGVWQSSERTQSDENDDQTALESMSDESLLVHAVKHLDSNYVCPMHPSVVSTESGNCPICGMDLVLRKSNTLEDSGVIVSAAMQRNMGLTTALVEYGPVVEEIYGSGEVLSVDKAHTTILKSKYSGSVQAVLVKEGDWVKEDDPIIVVKSAEYTKLKKAFVAAREASEIREMNQHRADLVKLGVVAEILRKPLHRGLSPLPEHLEVRASKVGKISNLQIGVGDKVKVGLPMLEITAPKLVRAELRSYSGKALMVKVGDRVHMEIAELPGRNFPGQVVRSVGQPSSYYAMNEVRFEFQEDFAFTGMFVGGYLEVGRRENVLRVPTSAVIYGDRSTRVVRHHEDGHFIVLDVEIGFETTDWIEIVSGLKEGGRVVTRGQFLIDSEATMQAGLNRLKEGDENL